MPRDQLPNIILMCVDGHTWDTAGPTSRYPDVTPNLNRLAEEGVSFSNAFCVTPLCHPSRASIMTGRYPHRHGITANLNPNGTTFSERKAWPEEEIPFTAVLSRAGYFTAHLGNPHWAKEASPPSFRIDYEELEQGALHQQGHRTSDPLDSPRIQGGSIFYGRWNVPQESTDTSYLGDRAIHFLEHAPNDRPFFLHVDWAKPHIPFVVPEPWASRVDPKAIEQPPNFEPSDTEPERVALWRRHARAETIAWDQWARAIALYLGCIGHIDANVGRILDALNRLNLSDRTLVIYTTDHGQMLGAHRLLDKGPGSYDDQFRVPLIVRWPGNLPRGEVCDALVQTLDLFPTFLDVTGRDAPAEMDGFSLLDAVSGAARRSSIFAQYHFAGWGPVWFRMARTRDWKFTYSTTDRGELYDLQADPFETRNLIDAPEGKDAIQHLSQELLRWMERTNDPLFNGAKRLLLPGPSENVSGAVRR